MNKKRTKSRESAKKMIPRRPLKKIDSKSTCTHKKGFHSVVNIFFHSKYDYENLTKCCENIQERIEWYLLCYSSEGRGQIRSTAGL